METAERINIGKAIASKIQVDRIYCIDHTGGEGCHLLIMLPAPGCGTKFSEIAPFVKMAIGEHEAITYTLYQTGEIRAALKKGNLLFHLTCSEPNLIYAKQDSPDLPQCSAGDMLAWKSEANIQFKDGADRASAFLEGAFFYQERGEKGLTVFMLHQFIELTYRTLAITLLATEKKTHNIGTHQALVTPLIPQLGLLFPADTPEEKSLLKTLNDAYSAVRYEQNHHVDESFIPVLFDRAGLLKKRAETIISELNKSLDVKIREAQVNGHSLLGTFDKPVLLGENIIDLTGAVRSEENHLTAGKCMTPELERVLALIAEHLHPDCIYVFGCHIVESTRMDLFNLKEHEERPDINYDLLIISPVSNPYGNNIQSMANTIDGITVNLFIHTKEEAMTQLVNHNPFFHTVFRNGNMIYSKTYVFDMGNIGQIDANESRGKTIKHCARRLVRAIAILKAAEPIRSDVFEVTVALLAQSLEQACLGIIYHFLGYSPNMHNLSHLLGICKIFWPENSSGFPVPTPYDKELLGILSKSHAEMRYTAGQSTETDDLDAAYSWCSNFVGAAEKVFLNSLSEMEKENYLSLS